MLGLATYLSCHICIDLNTAWKNTPLTKLNFNLWLNAFKCSNYGSTCTLLVATVPSQAKTLNSIKKVQKEIGKLQWQVDNDILEFKQNRAKKNQKKKLDKVIKQYLKSLTDLRQRYVLPKVARLFRSNFSRNYLTLNYLE